MRKRELAVAGAFEFSPDVFADDRGLFTSPFQHDPFAESVGRPLFPVRQASCSLSRKDVVRGVHFSRNPFGTAKYVYCPRGRALDVVVDIRPGSPTFGRWDSVVLDAESFRAVYLPVGVGHAFVALEDDTMMHYLLSRSYVAANELALHPLDPALALPIPEGITPVLSDRDTAAPTLAEADEQGILPQYADCLAIERKLYEARHEARREARHGA
ncbi:dTDP-4-dehydrorhamnose 3,5-epimerase family protein [Saccharothrix deserti]|uniref:dTDP-4-dehydrorhamnose 3,5-epimerase family protein n=1 Tax=Saccharothrix deserti TaxID=2593674 RepID=UPI00131CEB31|nr:dTDP-4-dehydrorhamnose 3,5-epimerase family protein [Saccharothrix deserti]